ncbi:MAG: VOC family protein [Rhodomicrobiaceae bacterium]
MNPKIFVNLAIRDLPKSMAFYEELGFKNNPQFTDETAACMVLSDEIYVMLLTHEKFKNFIPTSLADTRKSTGALYALTRESREHVDEMVRTAVAAGGNTYNEPQDHGFMYQHGFQDPDGHIWEPFYMNPEAVA